MAKYEKPMVIANDELAEGVFAASGCYTVTATVHQGDVPGTYKLQVDGKHNADHTREAQILTVNFNEYVTFISCNGQLVSPTDGKESKQIVIKYNYHQNPTDNIGLGDLVVTTSDRKMPTIAGCSITDDVE
ncbi:MAG: hypothetical protein K6F90_08200 [Lachnospiraceae bacterium]|nr:hypothetical protein [Lachnospiraceae bacterium]